jgi:hypothetical protein
MENGTHFEMEISGCNTYPDTKPFLHKCMIMIVLSSKHLVFWHLLHGHRTIFDNEKEQLKNGVVLSIHSSVYFPYLSQPLYIQLRSSLISKATH